MIDFLTHMNAVQFIVLFWAAVGLFVVWCVLDGLAQLFGGPSVLMMLGVLVLYGSFWGMVGYTIYIIGGLILRAMISH